MLLLHFSRKKIFELQPRRQRGAREGVAPPPIYLAPKCPLLLKFPIYLWFFKSANCRKQFPVNLSRIFDTNTWSPQLKCQPQSMDKVSVNMSSSPSSLYPVCKQAKLAVSWLLVVTETLIQELLVDYQFILCDTRIEIVHKYEYICIFEYLYICISVNLQSLWHEALVPISWGGYLYQSACTIFMIQKMCQGNFYP